MVDLRTPARASFVACFAFAALCACGDDSTTRDDSANPNGTAEVDWLQDSRLYGLLATTCPGRGPFTRDTSDMLPVMVQRLEDARSDVLRYVKLQLGQAGEDAIEPLSKAFASWTEGRFDVNSIANGLGALRLSDAPGAHDLCMRYVVHPSAEVRIAAAKALSRHALPEDYDLLMDLFYSVEPSRPAVREVLIETLATADPARFQRDLAQWMREGLQRGLWSAALGLALDSIDARTAGRFADIDPAPFGPAIVAPLLALQASGGETGPTMQLRTLLTAGTLEERSAALLVLPAGGHELWAADVLASEPLAAERSRAAAVLGPVANQPAARDALRLGLNDASRDVRLAALTALLEAGDPVAIDRALALYRGALGDVELASLALTNAWDATPELADRARDVLLERIEADAHDFDRIKPLYQALGLIPGRASAQALMAAHDEFSGSTIQGLDAHRWFARAASNSGPDGRAYLAERWRTETDELRRMNYLEAAGGAQDETSTAFLLDLVEGERATEYERLLAAEWLVRRGPATELAPLLKRVALRMEGERTRPAIDCLLWTWYG